MPPPLVKSFKFACELFQLSILSYMLSEQSSKLQIKVFPFNFFISSASYPNVLNIYLLANIIFQELLNKITPSLWPLNTFSIFYPHNPKNNKSSYEQSHHLIIHFIPIYYNIFNIYNFLF